MNPTENLSRDLKVAKEIHESENRLRAAVFMRRPLSQRLLLGVIGPATTLIGLCVAGLAGWQVAIWRLYDSFWLPTAVPYTYLDVLVLSSSAALTGFAISILVLRLFRDLNLAVCWALKRKAGEHPFVSGSQQEQGPIA